MTAGPVFFPDPTSPEHTDVQRGRNVAMFAQLAATARAISAAPEEQGQVRRAQELRAATDAATGRYEVIAQSARGDDLRIARDASERAQAPAAASETEVVRSRPVRGRLHVVMGYDPTGLPGCTRSPHIREDLTADTFSLCFAVSQHAESRRQNRYSAATEHLG